MYLAPSAALRHEAVPRLLSARMAQTCVEINQYRLTDNSSRHFSATWPRWVRRAVRTSIATPSSRRRVDGVEDDAKIQHERAVKF